MLVGALLAGYLLLSAFAPSNPVKMTVDTFYSDRFEVEDGRLAGDNRTNQVVDFFRLVDDEILLKGARGSRAETETEDMSSNPFSITFSFGLLISMPYFLLLVWLLVTTVRNNFRNSYTTIGLFLLLLQRPYLYHMSWSILIVATVWLIYHAARQRPRRAVVPR